MICAILHAYDLLLLSASVEGIERMLDCYYNLSIHLYLEFTVSIHLCMFCVGSDSELTIISMKQIS